MQTRGEPSDATEPSSVVLLRFAQHTFSFGPADRERSATILTYTYDEIAAWLGDQSQPNAGPDDDQDFFCWIGQDFTADQLISLYQYRHAIKERRDAIAVAICYRLECLLTPDDADEDDVAKKLSPITVATETNTLVDFIFDHWGEFDAADERTGLGAGFEWYIEPLLKKKQN